jgi:MFS family permease
VLVTAAAALFANFLTWLGLTPLYPDVARDLHVGADGLGVYFVIQGAINVGLQLPVGVIADRVGRRPIMTLGLVFMAIGQLLRWQASDGLVFGIGQIFIGLCGPFVVAASFSVVADAYKAIGRAQAVGVLQAAAAVGQGTGFLLAGILAPEIGWRGYCLCVAALPLLVIPLAATLPEPVRLRPPLPLRLGMHSAITFLTIPAAGLLAISAAMTLAAGSGSIYLLPFVAHQHRTGAQLTALLLTPNLVGSIIGPPLAGRWADRFGVRMIGVAAAAATCLALFGLALLDFSLPTIAICYTVIGAGVSSILGLIAVSVVDLANRFGSGTSAALGGMRVGQGLGPAVGPALCGFIFVHGGSVVAYGALAGSLAIAGSLLLAAVQSDQGHTKSTSKA